MAKKRIQRTREFSKRPGAKGKSFFIRDIPTRFWQAAQSKARRERRSMRSVILTLVKDWLGENGHAVRMADSEASREVRPVQHGDDLHLSPAEEAQGGTDDRQQGSQVPEGVDRRVAAEVGQREDRGVEVEEVDAPDEGPLGVQGGVDFDGRDGSIEEEDDATPVS